MQKKKKKKKKKKEWIVLLTSLKKNVFQSHANHPLVNSMGYIVNKFELEEEGPCTEGVGTLYGREGVGPEPALCD